MKIKRLSLKGYKIFDELDLDFTDKEGKALDVIVFAGTNGSGKTSLLEFIGEMWVNMQNMSIIASRPHSYEVFCEVEPNKYWDNVRENIERNYDVNILPNEILLTNDNAFYFQGFPSNRGGDTLEKCYYFPAEVYLNPSLGEENKYNRHEIAIGPDFFFLNFSQEKYELENVIVEHIKHQVFEHRNLPAEQVIQKEISYFNSLLDEVQISTKLKDVTDTNAIFESINGVEIGIDALSHGEKQLFFRAIYLTRLNPQNSIILVDEPAAALHPTWQQKIVKLYQKIGHNNQVIMATHSPHIIATVPPESLFVLKIDEERKRVNVVNMADEAQKSLGLEPNRILEEIMGAPLREYTIQQKINRLTALLTPESYQGIEANGLMLELREMLGKQDPFIIRLDHRLLMLDRQAQLAG